MLVRHGGAFYRVHPCHLLKLSLNDTEVDREGGVSDVQSNGCKTAQSVESSLPPIRQMVDDSESLEDNTGGDVHNADSDIEDFGSGVPSADSATFYDGSVKPSRNSYVKYKLNAEDDWNQAKVLSVQPKQTGQYRDWVNVHVDGQDDPICVNWDHVNSWSELPFPEQALVLTKTQ